MRVFLTGGTGFIGSYMTRGLVEMGHEVSVLTRHAGEENNLPPGVGFVQGDPGKPGPWQERVAEHDIVINLAGASIFTRWNDKVRRVIMDSRVLTTRHVVDALAARRGAETLLISASAVGYYGSRSDSAVLDESSPSGSKNDFLTQVSLAWESEARRAEGLGARVVITRFGIVLGEGGGTLQEMLPNFKRGLGSPIGSGKQWFSWIHLEDLLRIMQFLFERKDISGPVNCTAPNPVRNEEMTRALLKVLNKWRVAPSVPGFVVKAMLGEFGDVVLKGQRVIPKKLLGAGFLFRYPTIEEALKNLVRTA